MEILPDKSVTVRVNSYKLMNNTTINTPSLYTETVNADEPSDNVIHVQSFSGTGVFVPSMKPANETGNKNRKIVIQVNTLEKKQEAEHLFPVECSYYVDDMPAPDFNLFDDSKFKYNMKTSEWTDMSVEEGYGYNSEDYDPELNGGEESDDSVYPDGEPKCKCPFCKYACRKKGKLKKHMRTHRSTTVYNCTQCTYTTTHKSNLQKHQMVHNVDGKKLHQCLECNFSTNYAKTWRVHVLIHRGIHPYICSDCDKGYYDKKLLLNHMKRDHGVTVSTVECGPCRLQFRNKIWYKMHKCRQFSGSDTEMMQKTDTEKVLTTANIDNLKKENSADIPSEAGETVMLNHTGRFRCIDCNAIFSGGSQLMNHYNLCHFGQNRLDLCTTDCNWIEHKQYLKPLPEVTDKSPAICAECGDSFSKLVDYETHISSAHTDCSNCPECGITFVTLAERKVHWIVHRSGPPFKCSECDDHDEFPCTFQLMSHMFEHTHEEKPYKCLQCDYQTLMPKKIQNHQHQNHIKNVNKMVKKNIKKSGSINDKCRGHKRSTIHWQTKTYKCTECEWGSDFMHNLKRHRMKAHGKTLEMVEGEEQEFTFQCCYCDLISNGRDKQRTHLAEHEMDMLTDDKKYQCQLCSRVVDTRSKIRKHMQVHITKKEKSIPEVNNRIELAKRLLKRKLVRGQTSKKQKKHAGHSSVKNNKCNICDTVFCSNYSLGRHNKNVHKKKLLHESSDHHTDGISYEDMDCSVNKPVHSDEDRKSSLELLIPICHLGTAQHKPARVREHSQMKHGELFDRTALQKTISADTMDIPSQHSTRVWCVQCEVTFPSHQSLRRHVQTFHKRQLICLVKDERKEHVRNYHSGDLCLFRWCPFIAFDEERRLSGVKRRKFPSVKMAEMILL